MPSPSRSTAVTDGAVAQCHFATPFSVSRAAEAVLGTSMFRPACAGLPASATDMFHAVVVCLERQSGS